MIRWQQKARNFWREWLKPVFVLLLVTSALRSALADWNDVPTGSMKPTILEGDRIWINKLAYDFKVPFTQWHLAEWSAPQRGDIVVFPSPANEVRLVKRVVGLPGDTVALVNNQLVINGTPVTYAPGTEAAVPEVTGGPTASRVFATENLGTRPHPVMLIPTQAAMRSFAPVTVPAGHYFVMGDSRDNSLDSRYFGCVERRRILGRATAVALSFDREHYFAPRWQRWFTGLL